MPVIPTVLVNGSEGIGTGWSSYVPNYNPRDLVANVRRLLNGEPMEPMDPWYKGFRGNIEKTSTKETGVSYTISGIIEEIDETTLRITELPIRKWTQDYKEFLESIMTGNDKIKDPFIKVDRFRFIAIILKNLINQHMGVEEFEFEYLDFCRTTGSIMMTKLCISKSSCRRRT